ncbi:hypothetical protein WG68_07985 [Arsukibacterium ikkense]|uniref:Uncharacterized protein n=2 Tax=Arsukibacterium ikkense TaxID=336831 RepID=A0A0M2V4Z4_9GAMM|nr:hypothetical protein WG68_07985 [Arsukibacterium ikkense]
MLNNNTLLLNYAKTCLRSSARQWQQVMLNMAGLSVGLAAALLILLYVLYESAYDRQHHDVGNTYRAEQIFIPIDQRFPISSPAIAQLLNNYDKNIRITRFSSQEVNIRHASGRSVRELMLYEPLAVEANFTDFFSVEVLSGDLAQTLEMPNRIALSESEAERLFGSTDVLGRQLVKDNQLLDVTAVYKNFSEQTHLVAGSLRRIDESELSRPLVINNVYSYLRLPVTLDRVALEHYLTEQLNAEGYGGQKIAQIKLRPLASIHLHSNLSYEFKVNGSFRTVQIAILLAVLLLFIATINYVNMSTARAGQRAKEVGVRKALGAGKSKLISQFMLESVGFCLLSGGVAVLLVYLSLPFFNQLVGRSISPGLLDVVGLTLLVAVVIGLIAGLYPAFFMSSFDAKRVLSGDFQRGSSAAWLRKSLLMMQSAISVALIVSALFIQQQLQLLQSAPTGYDREHRLMAEGIPYQQLFGEASANMITALQHQPGVVSVSQLDTKLTDTVSQAISLQIPGRAEPTPMLRQLGTGYDIVSAAGFQLLAGRDFSRQFAADWYHQAGDNYRGSIIISEELLRQLGFSEYEQALGQTWQYIEHDGKVAQLTVVGVIADVQIGSALNRPEPLVLTCGYSVLDKGQFLLSIKPEQLFATSQVVHDLLADRLARDDIKLSWLSEEFYQVYQAPRRQGAVVTSFAVLAILLTCVGLFGLSSFSAALRTREIAIRTVLGAGRFGLIRLLTLEYLRLVSISAVMVMPLVFWLIERWLSSFSVRIQQGPGEYIMALVLTLIICTLTVAGIAYRTTSKSPALVLRQQ